MSILTVLIPTYNSMPYLKEAVESIQKQSFHEFILVIIDDGSTDNTSDYLRTLSDPRVLIIEQPNKGQGFARNAGLNICNTEYVALMDADDIAINVRFEKQISFLQKNRNIGMVGTQIECFGANGKSGFSPPLPLDHETIRTYLLNGEHAICQATVMCRTTILKNIGGYRIGRNGEDWDMFLRMSENTRLVNHHEVLHKYRIHGRNVTISNLEEVRTKIAYACYCAFKRAKGHDEPDYETFLKEYENMPKYRQMLARMDINALRRYRQGMVRIFNNDRIGGYSMLGWAAISSPLWTYKRIKRKIHQLWSRQAVFQSTEKQYWKDPS